MSAKKRRTWEAESMKKAVDAVQKKEMGYYKASKTFNVPQSTLEDYVRKCKDKNINDVLNTNIGRKPVLSAEIEHHLANYCKEMDERFYGLRSSDIRALAFQLALRNKIPNVFNKPKASAGKKWLKGFLKRHPQLTFRTPEKLSVARAKGFTRERVDAFFKLLKDDAQILKFPPHRIFNCDETGITVVQGRSNKIISIRGKKCVSKISSAERGALITVVTCMSPIGHFIPPFIIFPRKNRDDSLKNGTPPGSVIKCHPSGWMQLSIFSEWFEHFIDIVKPTPEDPVMLIFDGHYSHTRNIDVIDRAREKGITLVCLPPHSTHRLQPLDVSFMAPFKRFYSEEIKNWLLHNPFQCLKDKNVGPLMGRAYSRAATLEVAASGFRKCGIYPYDPLVFTSHDFSQQQRDEERPETPGVNEQANEEDIGIVSPFTISPPPTLPLSKPSARAGKAAVVTSSPFKRCLEESLAKKQSQECLSVSKPVPRTSKSKRNTKQKKSPIRKQHLEEDSDSSLEVLFNDSSSEYEEDEECIYCNTQWSTDTSNDSWIKCIKCFRWCHELCAGVEKKGWKLFKCDLCTRKD